MDHGRGDFNFLGVLYSLGSTSLLPDQLLISSPFLLASLDCRSLAIHSMPVSKPVCLFLTRIQF
jgi:hypothetical protein